MDDVKAVPSTDPMTDTGMSIDAGTETLHQLVCAVNDFIEAWEIAEEFGPPPIVDFLPEGDSVRKMAIFELIKVDLECRWIDHGMPLRLHDYVELLDDVSLSDLPADLIYEEFHVRRRAGLVVSIEECMEEYPAQKAALEGYFAMHPEYQPTLIGAPHQSRTLDDLGVGMTVDDFDLLVALGRGAFARVFLARQRSLQRFVAVKISADHGTEGQTLAQLDHDYIVRVYDQRVLESEQLRLLNIQYLPGGTLQGIVRRVRGTAIQDQSGQMLLDSIDESLNQKGEVIPIDSSLRDRLSRFSWPETIAWLGVRLALALDYACRQNVLHRDIKPANVLLSAEGVPKLADFNISFSGAVSGTTPAAYFGGSLAYMSPEQLRACHPDDPTQPDELDGRSDLYSLAVMLWELLTGQRPFVDENFMPGSMGSLDEMIALRMKGVPESTIAKLPPNTPETLRRVLINALEPKVGDRWETAAEMSQQLAICMEPRARELIDPARKSWRRWIIGWSVSIVVLLNLIPNIISAVINYEYNREQIVRVMAPEKLADFDMIQGIINLIAFPLGISLMVWLALKVKRSLTKSSPGLHSVQRNDCLRLGERCALICLIEWVIAGIAYPVSFAMAGAELPASGFVHFLGSLIICGLIATAYPFFGATWYSVHVLYPAMLQKSGPKPGDRENVRGLRRRLRIYLVMAASIPMLAISAVTFVSMETMGIVQALCIGGLAGFGGAFWFYRQLEEDLDALSVLLKKVA